MFADVIELYRAANRPTILNGEFEYAGLCSEQLKQAITACKKIPAHDGSFSDGPVFSNGHVEFTWLLANNDQGRFYQNVSQLVENSDSLSAGTQPTNFYLVDSDFVFDSANPPDQLQVAFDLCELVRLLSSLSLGNANLDPHKPQRLVFVLPAESSSPPKTIELTTRIEPATLNVGRLDLSLLRDLLSTKSESSLHVNEHRQLFRLAVADALSRAPDPRNAFTYLAENWPAVVQQYGHNADCYVHNFSFEKVRGEIADKELDFSTRLNSVMGDATAKLLALPLSVAGLIAVWNSDRLFEVLLLALGIVLTSLLMGGMIHNQLLLTKRVAHSHDVVFGKLTAKIESYPESVAKALTEANQGFLKQRRFLLRVLWGIRVLAWLPSFAAVCIVVARYGVAAIGIAPFIIKS